jgi:hypothetical protein
MLLPDTATGASQLPLFAQTSQETSRIPHLRTVLVLRALGTSDQRPQETKSLLQQLLQLQQSLSQIHDFSLPINTEVGI